MRNILSAFLYSPPNDHTDDSITGLDSATTAATVTAAPNEEAEDNESRVVDELLLSLEDEDSEIVVEAEAASRSPTASLSIPQGADSSCTSSNSEVSSLVVSEDDDAVCSASSSDSSSVSPHSFPLPNEAAIPEEADLCNAFGALNAVEEEEIPEGEEDGEETYQIGELPVNGSGRQKSNNNEDAESGNGQDTKNRKNISYEPVAFPWREIPIESDVDEEINSVRSTIDASLNSLNENSSIAFQEKTPKTSRRGESEGSVKHKKSKRKHFYLGGGGGKSSGAVGVTVASARIPQLPPYFVLELLPGLHFILSTVQSPLAASAIQALTQRANLELWSNVLLYTNSICNSKLYYDATDKAKTLHLNRNGPCQMEALIDRSNSIIGGRALSPSGSVVSSGSSHASSTLIRHDGEEELADHHQTIENSVLNRSHRKAPITNASFQVVRPEEDIPLVVDKPSQIKCTSLTVEIATRQRAKSLSPRHQSDTSETSPAMERVMEVPRVFHGLHCGGLCASGKTSRRHRTLSFNPRLCSALKAGRPKSPTNHKVTFVEETRESKEDNQSDASEPPHSA
ncbi:unnamed protein product [Hymenolepis diminuta]|uniref:Uncharacterized protein n=1 Tax=Hymenolepis diminuta TaxID=6216 RepID=A0A3P7BQU5_HYMDI|nr:unnamed protein product [Hymenolepis diminuta]